LKPKAANHPVRQVQIFLFFFFFSLYYTMVYQSTDQSTMLKQILERSKLQASMVDHHDLPPIDRDLEQIDSQTKILSNKTTQLKDDNVDIRA
jgi:hypothetical protein